MEFFNKAKSVTLRSHLDKYLFADDDQLTVRQSRSVSSSRSHWTVELVSGHNHFIRLKSCYGKYLSASDEDFLLNTTGKKVIQAVVRSETDSRSIDWEPRKERFHVKLKTRNGNYLRANGGTLPWRNSVTHNVPHHSSTQDWILWSVDVVEFNMEYDPVFDCLSPYRSGSSPISIHSGKTEFSADSSPSREEKSRESAMELFKRAKIVRFRGHHDKYLLAEDDEESVCQDRNGSVWNARWNVELVDKKNVLLFKSCFGKYLTASNAPFLFGMTGRKVLQTYPNRLDSSLEWEPIREGFQVRLKTHSGHFLRANGGLPPWRNSITHDIPLRSSRQDWILWNVDILEVREESPPKPVFRSQKVPKQICRSEKVAESEQICRSEKVAESEQICRSEAESEQLCRYESEYASIEVKIPKLSKQESDDSIEYCSAMKGEGRKVYYNVVVNDDGNGDESIEEILFMFKGIGLMELIQKLEEETGIENIVLCSRNPLNRKLYPLRLQLPPNNSNMHVVVVPASSKLARDFEAPVSPTAA